MSNTSPTSENEANLSAVEGIKDKSHNLRGTILEGLADESTGALSDDDTQLTKFHGIYQQDDRDLRPERRRAKQEKAFSFMIRVRVPGGYCTPEQWLKMDSISSDFGNETFKLTTRQAFQFHGVIKSKLQPSIRAIDSVLMDTLAACGDVNRNVMVNANPDLSAVHREVLKDAESVSAHLTPATGAYREIWIDGELSDTNEEKEDPIYGKTYLPRKFKIAFAIPPENDVDVLAHCLGFIAIIKDGKLLGYNVTVGGGMGMTHRKVQTFPRLGDALGFIPADKVVDVAEKIVTVQRDYGDRSDRKHARLKYTIEDRGVDWFRREVEKRLGYSFEVPKDFKFERNGDRFGWREDEDGRWHYTLFVEGGRVKDTKAFPLRTALREVAKIHKGHYRLTANQNVIIGGVAEYEKDAIESILAAHKVDVKNGQSGLRRNSIACVALPTCSLALAESERYLPKLITELDEALEAVGLRDDDIVIRMTGCPNGCARPYIGEVALVGRAPGKYNIYLGGGFDGTRLNKLYKESVRDTEIRGELEPIFQDYAWTRREGERFGDFAVRAGYVKATTAGNDFHENVAV